MWLHCFSFSQIYQRSTLAPDFLLPLWAEEVPGWCPASGPPRVPSTKAGLLTVPSSPHIGFILQWDPAGRTDQLLCPHHLLFHWLHVSHAPWRAGPVSSPVRGAQTEVGADYGADKGGGRGSEGHGEAAEAQRTQRVSHGGTGSRWCVTLLTDVPPHLCQMNSSTPFFKISTCHVPHVHLDRYYLIMNYRIGDVTIFFHTNLLSMTVNFR